MADEWHIGEFDERVVIQRPVSVRGDQGQKTRTWETHSCVWARVIRDVSRMIDNGNLEDGRSIECHIYKIPGLDTRWRVVVDGVPCDIRSIDMGGRLSPVCVLSLYTPESV